MTDIHRHTLLCYEYVEDVLERRAAHREAHLALIRAWKDEGRIVLAGAVGDPPHGGIFVLRDAADAQAFVDADPYVEGGVVLRWHSDPIGVVA